MLGLDSSKVWRLSSCMLLYLMRERSSICLLFIELMLKSEIKFKRTQANLLNNHNLQQL